MSESRWYLATQEEKTGLCPGCVQQGRRTADPDWYEGLPGLSLVPLLEGELLPQAKAFKYLRVLFKGDGKMECEMNRRYDARSAVLQVLRCSTEKGAELEGEALYIPVHLCATLSHCFKLWVVTERMRSWIQAAEMRFLKGAS